MPSLDGATEWLNSEPLGPAELRGHVVLVNFWTLTCINWLRQEPYVRAWSQAYRDDGLIVIGVHTPEFSFEHEIDRVRQAIEERGIDYPVAVDNELRDLERLRQPLLAGALLRRRGGRHPRPAFRRGTLRAIRARASSGCSASSAKLVAVRGRRRRGGGRLGPPAHARDIPRLRAQRAPSHRQRTLGSANRHAYELPEHLGVNAVGARRRRGRSGRRALSLERPAAASPSASTRATRISCCPPGHESRSPSASSSTARLPGRSAGVDVDEDGNGVLRDGRLYQLMRQRGHGPRTDAGDHIPRARRRGVLVHVRLDSDDRHLRLALGWTPVSREPTNRARTRNQVGP